MPWSSWLLLPSSVVLSTGKVNSLSGPATATGGLLFSVKIVFCIWRLQDSYWQGLPEGRFYTEYYITNLIYWLKGTSHKYNVHKPAENTRWERPAVQPVKSHSKYFLFSVISEGTVTLQKFCSMLNALYEMFYNKSGRVFSWFHHCIPFKTTHMNMVLCPQRR